MACKCVAYPLHTKVIQKRKIQSAIPLAIPFFGTATISTGRGYLPPSYITSHPPSCFCSPPLFSLPLCYLFNGRQHTGHTVPMRLQQNTTTCLTWDNKSQSHMGTLPEAARASSTMPTPKSFHSWICTGPSWCGLREAHHLTGVQIAVGGL